MKNQYLSILNSQHHLVYLFQSLSCHINQLLWILSALWFHWLCILLLLITVKCLPESNMTGYFSMWLLCCRPLSPCNLRVIVIPLIAIILLYGIYICYMTTYVRGSDSFKLSTENKDTIKSHNKHLTLCKYMYMYIHM